LSSLAFTYIPPPDYSTGDRVILEVKNGTASTWNNIVFTLSGASDPQYYDVCTSGCAQNNPPYPGVPVRERTTRLSTRTPLALL
jgi:hypothetical protein